MMIDDFRLMIDGSPHLPTHLLRPSIINHRRQSVPCQGLTLMILHKNSRMNKAKRYCKMSVTVGEFSSYWGPSNNIKAQMSGCKVQRGKEYRGFMMSDQSQHFPNSQFQHCIFGHRPANIQMLFHEK